MDHPTRVKALVPISTKKLKMKKVILLLFIGLMCCASTSLHSNDCGDSCISMPVNIGKICKEFTYYCGGEFHEVLMCVEPHIGTGKEHGWCEEWIQ